MDTIPYTRRVQEGKTLPASRSPAVSSSSLTHHILFFLLQVGEETCQNKLSRSRGLSERHQSLCHLLFCFCARQQRQLPLEFLCLRDLLRLTALPKDAAWSSYSCEPFRSFTFPLDTWTDPLEKWYLLQMSRHIFLLVASCPSQPEAWAGCLQHFSFSITLSVVSDVFAVAVCTRHFRATETLWTSKQSTVTHDCVRALQHTPWRVGPCSSQLLLLFRIR